MLVALWALHGGRQSIPDYCRRKHTLIASHASHIDRLQEVFLGGCNLEQATPSCPVHSWGLMRRSVTATRQSIISILNESWRQMGLPWWLSSKKSVCQCRRHRRLGFDPWVGIKRSPLEKVMATHSSIPAWRIPWTEEPGRLWSIGPQSFKAAEHALTQANCSDMWIYKELMVDETGADYTEWSKPERKTPIQYTNTYIWTLERW